MSTEETVESKIIDVELYNTDFPKVNDNVRKLLL